jgi:surface polysaccharide O-acyltransferase-like enzyme
MGSEKVDLSLRQTWADFCRVVAIFGVIVIHACAPVFNQYGKIPQSDWISTNLLDSFARCSVPLFVMLSGALLLKPGDEQVTLLGVWKRVSKVLIPLIVWNSGYLLYISHFTGESVKWLSMLSQAPMYHLWFIYMIIGVYLLQPMLQAVFQGIIARRDLQIYLLIVWVVTNCWPIYQPLPLLELIKQKNLLGYGGYFLIGGIVAVSNMENIATKFWIIIYLVNVAVTFYLTYYFSQRAGVSVETAYEYFSLNVAASSIAAFVVFYKIDGFGRFSSILQWVSDRCFLIFFMHVVILERVNKLVTELEIGLPVFLSILLISIITFFICLAISAFLRLLPRSRRVLG